MRWLLLALAVALGCGPGRFVRRGELNEDALDVVRRELPAVRGLTFSAPVPAVVMSPPEIQATITREIDETYAPGDVERLEAVYTRPDGATKIAIPCASAGPAMKASDAAMAPARKRRITSRNSGRAGRPCVAARARRARRPPDREGMHAARAARAPALDDVHGVMGHGHAGGLPHPLLPMNGERKP